MLAVLPLVVSIDSPLDSPLTANQSNAVSCTSYGSSPPAVISWWLDGVRLDHQDSQVRLAVIRPQVASNSFQISPHCHRYHYILCNDLADLIIILAKLKNPDCESLEEIMT